MIVRVVSTVSRVVSGTGSGSVPGMPQPSSKATRFSASKRPLALLTEPRPLRGPREAGISMRPMMLASMRTIQELSMVRPLSVVIPTLNAAAELPRTLAALPVVAPIGEVIVVDGGSRDASARIARRGRGADVIEAPRGRGTQLAAGANAARCEWLLFLHADCRPQPGWDAAVRAFIAAPERGRAGGLFHPRARRPGAGGTAGGADGRPGAATRWRYPMATRVC